MDTEQYAGIILGLLTEQLDKRFQYRIPDHLKSKVHVGSVVYVPFGAGNKKTKGFVIDISSDLSFDRCHFLFQPLQGKLNMPPDCAACPAALFSDFFLCQVLEVI